MLFLSAAVLAVLFAFQQAPAQPAGQPASQPVAQAPAQPAAQAANDDTTPPPRPAFLLRPSVTLNDVGIDTNIFGTATDPQRDTIGHVRLRAEPSLLVGPVKLEGTAAVGLSYFQRYTDQRSVYTNDSFRLDYRLNRLTLYASDAFLRSRDLFSPELDVRLPRTENTLEAGIDAEITGKTVIGAGVRHGRFTFGADALLPGYDLRDSLTRTEDGLTASLRNALTPLTTLVVVGDVERDRFDYSGYRDGNGMRVMTGLEFKPTALVSGQAYVGYRSRSSSNGTYPNASALVASLDLGYNPWAPIRLGVKIDRDLDHSYFATEQYYIVTTFSGSVTARLARAWEIGATAGRQRLEYGASALPAFSPTGLDMAPWSEYVNRFGGTLAYRMAFGAVIRFNADYIRRDSAIAVRTYDRLRLLSSLTLGFD